MYKKGKINSRRRLKLSIFAALTNEEAPLHIVSFVILSDYLKWSGSLHYVLLLCRL